MSPTNQKRVQFLKDWGAWGGVAVVLVIGLITMGARDASLERDTEHNTIDIQELKGDIVRRLERIEDKIDRHLIIDTKKE